MRKRYNGDKNNYVMLFHRRKSYCRRWPMQGRGEHLWVTLLGCFNKNQEVSKADKRETFSEPQELSVSTRSSTLSALTSKFARPESCLHVPFKSWNLFFWRILCLLLNICLWWVTLVPRFIWFDNLRRWHKHLADLTIKNFHGLER